MSKRGDTKVWNEPFDVVDPDTLAVSEHYLCHWTERLVPSSEAVPMGSFYPGVGGVWMSARDAGPARKESHRLFNESEGNCNTCAHLERVKHSPTATVRIPLADKETGKPTGSFREVVIVHGFLEGRCRRDGGPATPPPHPVPGGAMRFSPDDPMHMDCYESRDPSELWKREGRYWSK